MLREMELRDLLLTAVQKQDFNLVREAIRILDDYITEYENWIEEEFLNFIQNEEVKYHDC